METTAQQRWQLAVQTVAAMRGWKPDDPTCVLDAVEAVAVGREAEPGVLWSWRQSEQRYQAQVTVLALMEAVDYEEWLEPPASPSAEDWLGLVLLTVYEPQYQPPGAPAGTRWCFDYLP